MGGETPFSATAFLGLGSNQGDRAANLRTALAALAANGIAVLAASSVYETAPQGEILDQPDFYNAVVQVQTSVGPEALLDLCKQIELDLGRDPDGQRHAPRPIDIDVLLINDLVYKSDRLRVPHPEIRSRRFVLEPLLELDQQLVLPDDGRPAADHAAAVATQPVRRVGLLIFE